MSQSGLRVGLTGNIGSGKSTVAKIFELLNVPVYYADERAKRLMVEREDIRNQITDVFGEEVYSYGLQTRPARRQVGRGSKAGEVDDGQTTSVEQSNDRLKTEISQSDEEPVPSTGLVPDRADLKSPKSYQLNRAFLAAQVFEYPEKLALLNAIVHPAVAKDSRAWHDLQKAPYTLYEAAITFETGGYKVLDAVILVTAPEATRLNRVMARDGSSSEQVRARMARQWPEEKKLELADHRIENDGQKLLVPQVLAIHDILTKRKASVSGN
ncbi:dephospho-CoA kinase [Lewinellaceae bacterium SD302]|nr:dephospho-CoA kinase [Lewinellaceae bacterium SD302]